MKTIISIIGCMGIGKTTFYTNLQKLIPHVIYIGEPVESWINIKDTATGENLLERFYKDQKRWSYTFQNMVYMTRFQLLMNALKNNKSDVIITDGSLLVDKNVFTKMLYDTGKMDSLEWNSYNVLDNCYTDIVKDCNIIYIYLRCPPGIIYDRIIKRGRVEEINVSKEYVIRLCSYLEDIVSKQNNTYIFEFTHDESSNEYNDILQQIAKMCYQKNDN